MIGVICEDSQKPFVSEFFQLFKTPWEFYVHSKTYDVVIVTYDIATLPDAKLVMVFSPKMTIFDGQQGIRFHSRLINLYGSLC
jgi:hypothetical protein